MSQTWLAQSSLLPVYCATGAGAGTSSDQVMIGAASGVWPIPLGQTWGSDVNSDSV